MAMLEAFPTYGSIQYKLEALAAILEFLAIYSIRFHALILVAEGAIIHDPYLPTIN
jgi:hypothetical protein